MTLAFVVILLACGAYAGQEQSDEHGFPVLGAVIGTPSGISLVGGYYFKDFAFRASGGWWEKGWYGVQGDLSVFLSRSSSFAQGLSLIAGRFGTRVVVPGDQQQDVVQQLRQSYAGLSYDAYYAGFFLQIGLGFGKGDFPNPNLAFQCGYLFELR
jgi:hypothetical protein